MASLDFIAREISNRYVLSAVVLVIGITVGYVIGKINRRLLERLGVPESVEGTSFERTMQNFGTSTVSILSRLSMWFIIGVTTLAALSVAEVQYSNQFWSRVTGFLPEVFVAIVVLIIGVVVGDKFELLVSERLRSVKLPQISLLPRLVKYSVVYIAALIALSQIGVATNALLVLLFVYFFAVVVFAGVAFKDLLASGAAGLFLLLTQPYGIGDEIRIGGRRGIVQEVTVFTTRIEADDREYVVPNRHVFTRGIVKFK